MNKAIPSLANITSSLIAIRMNADAIQRRAREIEIAKSVNILLTSFGIIMIDLALAWFKS